MTAPYVWPQLACSRCVNSRECWRTLCILLLHYCSSKTMLEAIIHLPEVLQDNRVYLVNDCFFGDKYIILVLNENWGKISLEVRYRPRSWSVCLGERPESQVPGDFQVNPRDMLTSYSFYMIVYLILTSWVVLPLILQHWNDWAEFTCAQLVTI